MKVFLQSIVAQLLLNPYVFLRGYQAIPAKKSWRIPYALLFVIELSVYLTGFFFRKALPDDIMIPILQYCGAWYIFLLYSTMALLAVELLRLSNRKYAWYPRWIVLHWKEVKLALFFVITAGVGGLLAYGNYTVTHPVVTHVDVTLPKGTGRLDSLTIVMMSDLHIGEVIGKEMVQKYVALSNGQSPDMVVLVGDIMDYESRHAEQARIEEDLQQLQAPLGVYAVYGNHEYRANRRAKKRWLQKTGATLLVDSAVSIAHSFYLVGRDDRVNKKRAPLHALMKGIDTGKPVIVLDHQPLSFAEMSMNNVALGLCGHTHNGQLWPYPLLMKLIYECPYGYHRRGPTRFYVSSGIGVAGPPYRIGTVSELVVLHIRFTG
ncbi:MAG: metallophosphoesterase [Tannerellaceae bacterium]|jgi:predicted MPP superfamily phosphohydrolase|nr:metallophosphoesterase [Tannerellaceae bacterium]